MTVRPQFAGMLLQGPGIRLQARWGMSWTPPSAYHNIPDPCPHTIHASSSQHWAERRFSRCHLNGKSTQSQLEGEAIAENKIAQLGMTSNQQPSTGWKIEPHVGEGTEGVDGVRIGSVSAKMARVGLSGNGNRGNLVREGNLGKGNGVCRGPVAQTQNLSKQKALPPSPFWPNGFPALSQHCKRLREGLGSLSNPPLDSSSTCSRPGWVAE